MKPTGLPQTNTRVYWDDTYGNPIKAYEYKASSKRFDEAIKHIKDGDKFIDIGCGVGTPGRMLRKNNVNCEIWGVDISSVVIEQNRKDDPEGKFYQGYIGSLDFLPKTYFDVIFCGETIEHLDDPMILFKEAYQILRPEGILIITTPIENKVGSEEHVWSLDKNDLTKLYADTGFKNLRFIDLPDIEHTLIFFCIGEK